jgi:hypothetical protein
MGLRMEHLNEMIDAYLEGSLSTFERQRLEKILADFPSLRSVVESRKPNARQTWVLDESDDGATDLVI